MPDRRGEDAYATTALQRFTPRTEQLVHDTLREFSQFQVYRNTHAAMWEETAELILPNFRNTFFYQNFNWPGVKKTDRQVDSTGMLALQRFKAICDSLLTPRNSTWHQIAADDDYVMKDRATKLYFEQLTRLLFKERYEATANFASQNIANFEMLGAFGNINMFIDELDGGVFGGARGLRYAALPLGEVYWRQNHQGVVDGFIRWFRLTAYQAMQKWGLERLPPGLRTALEQHSQWPYSFLHRVVPRDDFDPDRLDHRGKPWLSAYVAIDGQCLMQPEGGYSTFPLATGRYDQAPGEVYGRGPAQAVLPALKTLNAEKRIFLKQGHRAADPVLLTADDGVTNYNLRPGSQNAGGVSQDGKLLVHTLPSGDIQISKEMMQAESTIINDSLLVTLFQILVETPQMSATEVIERTNEKGILLAPTVGRQQSEYLGSMIPREIAVLGQQGLLPPMPPRLREAQGSYRIIYTSPLAKAQRAQEAAGFIRTIETAKEVVAITQDPSYLDPLNFDEGLRMVADVQCVPASLMASDDEIAEKRKKRAQAAQAQQSIQAAPAKAAIMKAQAAMMKAGAQAQQPQEAA